MIEFQNLQFNVVNSHPIPIDELLAVEMKLGFSFPVEYRAFITTFGEGETNLSIRSFAPRDIIINTTYDTRAQVAEYWFWT